MNVSLKATGVTKRYPGVLALNDVSFECRPGEIHAILGENGSGKSTLLGIASGSVTADSGSIEIMGKPLPAADPLAARALGLATVYQDDSLVRELTVAENLYLGAAPRWVAAIGKNEWAAELLAPYGLGMAPDALVGSLTPAQRQFLEIAKALSTNPKVLLLDEPTSTLDLSGVEKLSAIIREVAANGTAVVYVSHRLPEILSLANRVTILRDGQGQGTHEVGSGLSERDLIALMVGRPIEAEYPERGELDEGKVTFWAAGLGGSRFSNVSFHVHRGEVVGFAGAEGNGQRDAIRALGGLEPAQGHIYSAGKWLTNASPAEALAAGIFSLSADRSQESMFAALGVRENITVQVVDTFASRGIVSAPKERTQAAALVQELDIVTPTLEQPVSGLSGGNQQKTVLARSFLYGANVLLIDEPTQGVDAKARFDIYRAIRAKVDEGVSVVVNSSDAMELAGICDRVLVFSRGRVVRVLKGEQVTEQNIVGAFLTAREAAKAANAAVAAESEPGGFSWRTLRAALVGGSTTWWTPIALLLALTALIVAYAAWQSSVFLSPLNLRHILLATAPLALATIAQFNVLMVRGFDMSVGALMSLTVVMASYVIAAELAAGMLLLGVLICLCVGFFVGLVNGAIVRYIGVNAVITTIAMLSVLQGFALYGRPSPIGAISTEFLDLLTLRIGFVPLSFIAILGAAILGDIWLYRTRSGLKLRAVGFREEAAKRNGVRVNFVQVRAYVLSSVIGVLAGFFLASEVGFGHPTVGNSYTLTSIAAAVLGGAALSGGRGSFIGAVLGALFFTIVVNIITLLGLNTGAGIIISGALTLFAVMLYSGWEPFARLWAQIRGVFDRLTPAARQT
jgi:ribose transport system ATP-binding protein